MNKWFTTMEVNGVKVETFIEKAEIVEGDNLTGTLYISSVHDEETIDCISLKALKVTADGQYKIIGKHSFELVGNIHSKDMEIVPFELIPDERWVCSEHEHIVFQTIVTFLNGTEIKDEGIVTYVTAE